MSDQERWSVPGLSGPGNAAALTRAGELVRAFSARPGYALSDAELLESVRAVYALAAVVEGAKLRLVAALDARPGALPGITGSPVSVFLREGLRVSGPQAARDLHAARAIASSTAELPVMGHALADGEVSREHLDVAVATMRRLPRAIRKKVIDDEAEAGPDPGSGPEAAREPRTGARVIDEILTEQARQLPPATVKVLGDQIVHRFDPDRAERFTDDAHQRRDFRRYQDATGMFRYEATLDPATDAPVMAAILAAAAPRPTGTAVDEHGRPVPVRDQRTHGQRCADALADLVLAGATTLPTAGGDTSGPDQTGPDQTGPTEAVTDEAVTDEAVTDEAGVVAGPASRQGVDGPARGLPPGVFAARPCPGVQVTAVATWDQLAAAHGATDPAARHAGLARLTLAGPTGAFPGATLAPETLARLSCDNPLRRVLLNNDGAVLHHGRAKRLATPAQRRALAARDLGCVIPGCALPPDWCDVHHVIPWRDGGLTNIDEMVLLCGNHHTALHAGTYRIQMRHGIPWVQVPAWQDIARPWLRNTTHHQHRVIVNHLGRKLTEQPTLPWDTTYTTDPPEHAA